MTLYEILRQTNLPVAYGSFEVMQRPPFLVYIGTGQDKFAADNTYYKKQNTYQIEYYFKVKDETKEAVIEQKLLDNGFLYEKSEDSYIESENLYVIYYSI